VPPSVAESPPAHRRRLDFMTWPDVLADVEHLHRAHYDRLGNWDLSQTLEHLGVGLQTALRGTEHQGPWIIRKFIGPLILKRIVQQRRMRAGIKVPPWWLPGPSHDESAALGQFRADVTAFQQLSTRPFPHPYFGPLTKKQWQDLALIHAAHHLSFLIPRDNVSN
jgi:Protein of unknown function (DUF1569)